MTSGRRTRTVSLAAAVLALGIGFHALAGGAIPGPIWLVGLAVATLAGAWRLTASRPGVAGWAIATVGGQTLVHGVLTASAGHGHADTITDPVALALHRITEELTLAHAPMALAHAAAATGVGLWLAYGDRVLSLLASVIADWWSRIADPLPVPAQYPPATPIGRQATGPRTRARRTPQTLRGPPALLPA